MTQLQIAAITFGHYLLKYAGFFSLYNSIWSKHRIEKQYIIIDIHRLA